jgi:hypothetical protein
MAFLASATWSAAGLRSLAATIATTPDHTAGEAQTITMYSHALSARK